VKERTLVRVYDYTVLLPFGRMASTAVLSASASPLPVMFRVCGGLSAITAGMERYWDDFRIFCFNCGQDSKYILRQLYEQVIGATFSNCKVQLLRPHKIVVSTATRSRPIRVLSTGPPPLPFFLRLSPRSPSWRSILVPTCRISCSKNTPTELSNI